MPRRVLYSLVLATGLLLSVPAQAQGPSEEDKQNARKRLQPARVDPASTTPLRVPVPQFTFVAEKGKQEVKGTIGADIGDTNAYVELAGPIGENAKQASPLTLSGLANGARVTVGVSRNRLFLAPSTELLDAMEALCEARTIDPCAMSRATTAEDRQAFMALFVRRVPTFYGVSATLNRDEFEYLSPDFQADLTATHGGVGLTASAAALFRFQWFLSGFLRYERAHEPSSETAVEVCTPLTSGALKCRETRLAPPVLNTQTQFGIELRHRFESIGVGIAPRLEYRFDDDHKLIEVPLYFLRDTSDAERPTFGQRLNGGVSVGWKTADGLVARAFIGVAFDLLKLP